MTDRRHGLADDAGDDRLFSKLLLAARSDEPPAGLHDRVADYVDLRARLARRSSPPLRRHRWALAALVPALLGVGLMVQLGARGEPPPITKESVSASAAAAPTESRPKVDPCSARRRAPGVAPLIDDFEDGDDAIAPVEHRAGFWRWARETDRPGTAPALLPMPRPDEHGDNRFALHVKGQRLFDWGAAVEFNFEPSCYDASQFAGVTFHAKGPGRIYLAPREVSVIPVAEGGVCEADCHNPHVTKVDLGESWQAYAVRWEDVRQRGIGKPPLDPGRLHSVAFLIRPEDTPYDVWLDDVKFIPR